MRPSLFTTTVTTHMVAARYTPGEVANNPA